MSIKQTIWRIAPHTRAKHAILDCYLKAWLPIMSTISGRILYIDGFAGPGKYLDKKGLPTINGSPLIALNAAIKHKLPLETEIIFLFIEARHDRCEYLKGLLASISLPKNMKYEVKESKFDETIFSLLDYLDEQKKRLTPAFVFVDPFGYSDTPLSVIKRIMENPKCEVLINFMYLDVNRFLSDPDKVKHFDLLFGTDEWRKIAKLKNPRERKLKICGLYQKQLRKEAEIKYIRFFEMINKFNQTEYFLFFGSNHIEGLKKMKYAMWKMDPWGAFRFSDRTNPNQIVFFEPEPNYELLKRLISERFCKKMVSIREVEEFVVEETAFRETHFKRQILKQMEETDPPEIIVKGRKRRGTYPKGTIIEFLR